MSPSVPLTFCSSILMFEFVSLCTAGFEPGTLRRDKKNFRNTRMATLQEFEPLSSPVASGHLHGAPNAPQTTGRHSSRSSTKDITIDSSEVSPHQMAVTLVPGSLASPNTHLRFTDEESKDLPAMDTTGVEPEATGGAKRPRVPSGETPVCEKKSSAKAAAASIIQKLVTEKNKKNSTKSPLAKGKAAPRPSAKFLSIEEGKEAHEEFLENLKHCNAHSAEYDRLLTKFDKDKKHPQEVQGGTSLSGEELQGEGET